MSEQLDPKLLDQIIQHLGHPASADPGHRGKVLIGGTPNCPSIYLRHFWRDASRIEVSVSWPRDARNGWYEARVYASGDDQKFKYEMTVSAAKSPERIGADINKRLLARYLRVYAELRKLAEASDRYERTGQESAAQFARETGCQYTPSRHDMRPSVYLRKGVDGEAHFSGAEVKLELSTLTVAEAVNLVGHLRALRNGEGKVAA